MLCLAQRQYALLQAANLLTPDMTAEFETLQQLVQEEKTEPETEASGTPGAAGEAPLTQELCSESSESCPCSASTYGCCLQSPAGDRGGVWWLGPQILGYAAALGLDPWDHELLHPEKPQKSRQN